MFPTRLGVTFDSNLLDHSAKADRLPAALAHLRDRLMQRFGLQVSTVEFALIAALGFTPFVVAALVS